MKRPQSSSLAIALVFCSMTVHSFVSTGSKQGHFRHDSCSSLRFALPLEDDSFLPSHNNPSNDDFESLYQEQTAAYGIDLAKEFQREQMSRDETLQAQRERLETQLEEPSKNTAATSAGFFKTTSVSVSSTPTRDRQRAEQRALRRQKNRDWDPSWPTATTTETPNGDNILLIWTVSMATTAQPVQPLIISTLIMALLFWSYWTMQATVIGDDMSLWSLLVDESHSHILLPSQVL